MAAANGVAYAACASGGFDDARHGGSADVDAERSSLRVARRSAVL